jgi:hypothetical protein
MSNISLRPSRDSSNPSSNRMLTSPRFPMLRMGSRISLEDGSRATIVGTGTITSGNGSIGLHYIVRVDAAIPPPQHSLAQHTLINVENIDADGRFIK